MSLFSRYQEKQNTTIVDAGEKNCLAQLATEKLFLCFFLYFIQLGNVYTATMCAKHYFIISLLNSDIMNRN